MDGLKPRRSAVSRVGNYSEFNSFGFDNLEHLKDRYYSTAPVVGMASVELNRDPEVVLKTREAMEGDKVGHEAQECEVVGGDSAMGSVEGDNTELQGKRLEVLQGPSSGSMVSNLDLNMLDDL